MIYCDFTVRFQQSEKDPDVYTDSVHKWPKKDYDDHLVSTRIMGICDYAELDHDSYPVGPNSIDILPVYPKAMLARLDKFFDKTDEARVAKFLSSLGCPG